MTTATHPEPTHDPKFLHVNWYGQEYVFTPAQAKCVKVLWNFWKLRTPIIREEMVLEVANLKARTLKDVFSTGPGRAAWGTMIGDGDRRGTVRLLEPADRNEAATPKPAPQTPAAEPSAAGA